LKPVTQKEPDMTQDNKSSVVANGVKKRRRLWPTGLSGKLLVLTILFVMLAEVLVFVPSIANFRLAWLSRHFTTGEAASLTLEELNPEAVPEQVRKQLLSLTQTEMIVVRRDGASKILATNEMPGDIARHIELMQPGRLEATSTILDALDTLFFGGDRTIRVYGPMEERSGTLELVMKDGPLRQSMLSYAYNVLLISLLISFVTALLVFFTLRWFLIRPMQRMTQSMLSFSKDPENQSLVIQPSGRHDEIGVAEEQLNGMQQQLSGTFKQQRHLADLGLAVSKINHDLRNILASASLFSDRLADTSDPTVQRLAPRLIRTIDRAVDYTRSVLDYGKAGEAVPSFNLVRLHQLCQDVAETLSLDTDSDVEWVNRVPEDLEIHGDAEQIFRVIVNLSRNALQAMDGLDGETQIKRLNIGAGIEDGYTVIRLRDTGPGLPASMRENLFTAFNTSGRQGGTGLGLAIAAELVRAHNGTIRLIEQDGPGAEFEIALPIRS
jgi:signal transduction histidine kinase